MATYFTGPNASDYLGYVEAENRRRAAQAATTNQLISDIARTAVARDRANNELTLGQGALANDRYGMDNRSAMLDRELANRTAMSNSANELARYQHATVSADAAARNTTQRDIYAEQGRLQQQLSANQLALLRSELRQKADQFTQGLGLERVKALAPLAATQPVSPETAQLLLEQRAADTAQLDSLNKALVAKGTPGVWRSLFPNWIYPQTPEDRTGWAVQEGYVRRTVDPKSGRVSFFTSGPAEGLQFDPVSGSLIAPRPQFTRPPAVPGLMNELLRGQGFAIPDSAPVQDPGPAAAPTPGGNLRTRRFGPAALDDKRAGFVPVQDNPVAAPPQQLPPEPAPYYGPPKPRASARTPMTGIPEIDNAAATARSADLMSSADAQVAAARRRTAGMQSEYDALKNQLARNINRAKNPDATRMYDFGSELDPLKRVTVVNQLLQRMRELEGPLGIAYQ